MPRLSRSGSTTSVVCKLIMNLIVFNGAFYGQWCKCFGLSNFRTYFIVANGYFAVNSYLDPDLLTRVAASRLESDSSR